MYPGIKLLFTPSRYPRLDIRTLPLDPLPPIYPYLRVQLQIFLRTPVSPYLRLRVRKLAEPPPNPLRKRQGENVNYFKFLIEKKYFSFHFLMIFGAVTFSQKGDYYLDHCSGLPSIVCNCTVQLEMNRNLRCYVHCTGVVCFFVNYKS